MNVRPLHDRIIVQRIEEGEQKIGGIIIPDSAKEKPQEAEVLALGTGKDDEGNDVTKLFTVKKGDKVQYLGSDPRFFVPTELSSFCEVATLNNEVGVLLVIRPIDGEREKSPCYRAQWRR